MSIETYGCFVFNEESKADNFFDGIKKNIDNIFLFKEKKANLILKKINEFKLDLIDYKKEKAYCEKNEIDFNQNFFLELWAKKPVNELIEYYINNDNVGQLMINGSLVKMDLEPKEKEKLGEIMLVDKGEYITLRDTEIKSSEFVSDFNVENERISYNNDLFLELKDKVVLFKTNVNPVMLENNRFYEIIKDHAKKFMAKDPISSGFIVSRNEDYYQDQLLLNQFNDIILKMGMVNQKESGLKNIWNTAAKLVNEKPEIKQPEVEKRKGFKNK